MEVAPMAQSSRRARGPVVKGGRDRLDDWLTRNSVMDMLGITLTTLRQWEHRGRLTPVPHRRRGPHGQYREVYVYDPNVVAKLPRRAMHVGSGLTPGEVAARAYEMFDDGRSIRDVVKEVREPSDKVRQLHEQWLDDGGADLVLSATAKGELEAKVGPFATIAELVDRVRPKK